MAAPAAVVAKDAPILETCDRVLDPGAAPAMDSPSPVAHDATAAKARRTQLLDAAIAAIGEHTSMRPTEGLDWRVSVVNWIVAVARAAGDGRHDRQVTATDQELGIARPAVVLGPGSTTMISCRDERSIEHPGGAAIVEQGYCGREPRRHRGNDPMHRGPWNARDGGELAEGQVGS